MSEEVQEIESSAPERTTEELDKLADESSTARNSERPMSAPKETAESRQKAAEEKTYEIVHNGKKIQATGKQIMQWAQQGYDYPQKAQKLNQERAKWEAERKQWEIYREIDEYAKKNGNWWNHILGQWQSRGTPQASGNINPTGMPGTGVPGATDPYATKFQTLEQKLAQIEPVLQQFQQERIQAKERAEDQQLDSEIQSIRGEYADLDWNSLDENGKSLELKILEHAQATGIPSFRAAMRDLLHAELLGRAEAQAKLNVSKGIQRKTKLGVLGESSTSQKAMPRSNKDIRKQSYEEIQAEINEEIRQGRLG